MMCFFCELEPGIGGTKLRHGEAVGFCVDCGTALCMHHAHRAGPGQPLRCPEHPELAGHASMASGVTAESDGRLHP